MTPITDEIWRPIPGYEGVYDISSHGRVRSWARKGGPCIRRLRVGGRGYLNVTLRANGGSDCRAVHTLVLLAFRGPRPEGMVTRHLDGDTSNNHISNLAYGTQSQNILDQIAHGTHAKASRASCAKGHPFTPENTYVNPGNGSRVCRECCREWERARYARQSQDPAWMAKERARRRKPKEPANA